MRQQSGTATHPKSFASSSGYSHALTLPSPTLGRNPLGSGLDVMSRSGNVASARTRCMTFAIPRRVPASRAAGIARMTSSAWSSVKLAIGISPTPRE